MHVILIIFPFLLRLTCHLLCIYDNVCCQTTGEGFDRELQDNYTLTVQVEDSRQTPRIAHCVVTVHILDINDNAPVFVNQPYFAIVSINAEEGESVKEVVFSHGIADSTQLSYSLAIHVYRSNMSLRGIQHNAMHLN